MDERKILWAGDHEKFGIGASADHLVLFKFLVIYALTPLDLDE